MPRRPALDVYLLPAVVGGGWGDIGEVRDAGEELHRAGFRPQVLRLGAAPWPREVTGPWGWTSIVRAEEIRPRSPRALTVSACWGLAAAPHRSTALGRAGPWADEVVAIEAAYGPEHTLHVSLEEFARTLSSHDENRERFREGGVGRRETSSRTRGAAGRADRATWRRAFRLHRGLDRPNVLHLFATFSRSPGFGREFPEAVQVGPLWPTVSSPDRRARSAPSGHRPRVVLWYASPSSSPAIAPDLVRGLGRGSGPVRLDVRSPRPFSLASTDRVDVRFIGPQPPASWSRRFAAADLRVVTGSRTLLEAIDARAPFLYFNGVLGTGRRRRRHRPEKVRALLSEWRRRRVDPVVVRDVEAFSRGQRVAEVAARALFDRAWRSRFPSALGRAVSRLPDAGTVLGEVAREFARGDVPAPALVRAVRARLGGSGRRRSTVGLFKPGPVRLGRGGRRGG